MVRDGVVRGFFALSLCAGTALVSLPARALDDGKGNSLMDVLDVVGLGEKKEEAVIQYRERPPLVLPPKSELRQPVAPAGERAADWPRDQESVRAAKRAQDARGRAAADDTKNPQYAGKLTRMGRINAEDAQERSGYNQPCSMSPDSANKCDPNTFWNSMATRKEDTSTKGLQAGVEPDRQFLTQPPKGYMAPSKNVAATFEPTPKDDESVFDYVRRKVTQ